MDAKKLTPIKPDVPIPGAQSDAGPIWRNMASIDIPTSLDDLRVVLVQNENPVNMPAKGVLINGLSDIADLAKTDDGFIVGDGTTFVLETGATVLNSLGLQPYIGIRGLVPSQAADADHDLTFTTGACSDDTEASMMVLSSALTKQSDATWAAGSAAGAMVASESLPTSGTVHWWLIAKADGTTDICCNNHASSGLSPTLPTDYIYKRRTLSITTDSSANLTDFSAIELNGGGLEVLLNTPTNWVSTNSLSTTASTPAVGVPLGVKFRANIQATGFNASAWQVLFTATDQADTAPSATVFSIRSGAGTNAAYQVLLRTNTSGQVRVRSSAASTTLVGALHGWTDTRT